MSGKLIMNALVIYDHQTNTLWSQFLSQVVKSPLVNEDLEIVPAVQTSRQQWVNFHPDTLVLDKGGSYGSDVNNGYYNGGLTGIIGESNKGSTATQERAAYRDDRVRKRQGLSLQCHLLGDGHR